MSNCTNLVKFTGHIFVDAIDLSNCTSLEEIEIPKYYVTKSEIKNLNISGCSALKSLNADEISMTTLDLSNCTALEELNCDRNNLSKLDLGTCVALEKLDCSYNQLTTLYVKQCLSLTSIDCSNNPITDLDLSGLSSLKDINCTWEGMVSFNASNCISWEINGFFNSEYGYSLSINSSTLTDVILDNCTTLQHRLSIDGENLKSLSMKNCTGILTLWTENNPNLASLNIEGCTSLNEVRCYNDNFTDEMMNKIFTDLPIEEDGIIYCDGIGDPSIAEEKGWNVTIR